MESRHAGRQGSYGSGVLISFHKSIAARTKDPHCAQAEADIEAEVTRRLELSGADFTRWPRAAREETARLEKKLDAAHQVTATLHAELDASGRQRQSEAVARAQLQVWSLARVRAVQRGLSA